MLVNLLFPIEMLVGPVMSARFIAFSLIDAGGALVLVAWLWSSFKLIGSRLAVR